VQREAIAVQVQAMNGNGQAECVAAVGAAAVSEVYSV
jgi:hypothetical protein